ncbi:Hypothetical predicted protein, partial [Mytilus galloprovincialis]
MVSKDIESINRFSCKIAAVVKLANSSTQQSKSYNEHKKNVSHRLSCFRKHLFKVFQTTLQKSFLNLGESQPMFSMNTLGEAGTLKAVTSCSLARWLKLVLSNAGINVLKFKAHSYRSASSSAAKRADECSYPYRRVGKGCYLIQKDKVSGDTAF